MPSTDIAEDCSFSQPPNELAVSREGYGDLWNRGRGQLFIESKAFWKKTTTEYDHPSQKPTWQ